VKSIFFSLLAVAALLAGCASPAPDVSSYYDQVSGLRTDLMENELESPGQPREIVWLNASRVFHNRKETELYLEATYMAMKDRGFLEIPPGKTLTIIADGKPMVFEGSGSMNMRKPYKRDLVRETALYPVTKAQLQRIASSKEVKVQIKGNNGLVEREFKPVNFERLRKFVSYYAV
jgi:uncharacterized beta-barrel protein YwiB (DUF1934 family)